MRVAWPRAAVLLSIRDRIISGPVVSIHHTVRQTGGETDVGAAPDLRRRRHHGPGYHLQQHTLTIT